MIPYLSDSRRSGLALIAVLAVGLWPAATEAAVLAFRNETDSPIMVRGISIVNRIAQRGKLHVLRPGEVSRELIVVPGPKLIIVIDPKQPTRILCQEPIQFTGTDLFFAIQPEEPEKPKEGDKGSGKANERKGITPKVKLVPKLAPAATPPPIPRR